MKRRNGFSLSSTISISFVFALIAVFSNSSSAQRSGISSVVVTAANASPTGNCPIKVDFTGKIKAEGPTSVSYQWVRSDGSTGPVENLVFNSAVERTIPYDWTIGGGSLRSFDGWVKLRVISPTVMESQPARFSMRCTTGRVNPQTVIQPPIGGIRDNIGRLLDKSAEFRIILTGFICNHPTDDKRLEEDGAGDEVFLRTEVSLYNASTRQGTVQPFHLTKEIGDTNGDHSYRTQGGSARNILGGNGGFMLGDSFPSLSPWNDRSLSNPLPFLVWQGTLTSEKNGLAIIPSIWETDDNPIMLGNGFWSRSVDEIFGGIGPKMAENITRKSPTERFLPSSEIRRLHSDLFIARGYDINDLDRPIGLYETDEWYKYEPQVVVLNYESASYIADHILSGETHSRGVFLVRYTDQNMHGDYTLYFYIERVTH